jgi:hypothetical protein
MIKGTVSGFQQRWEQRSTTIVWNFRIERRAADGQPLPRVSVEIRGHSIEGSIVNGDVVEFNASYQPDKTFKVSRIRNLTSNSVVQVTKYPYTFMKFMFFLVWLLGVTFILSRFLRDFR